MTSTVE